MSTAVPGQPPYLQLQCLYLAHHAGASSDSACTNDTPFSLMLTPPRRLPCADIIEMQPM